MSKDGENSPTPGTEEEQLPVNSQDGAPSAEEGGAATPPENDANTPADSSPADTDAKEEKPKSLLDVVKDAVQDPKEKESSSDSAKGKADSDTKKGEGDEAGKGAKKEGEDDEPPFHKHPRWQEKLEENRQLKAELDRLKPAAEQHMLVDGFMQQNNLIADEVVEGLRVMALIKNDPERAYRELGGYMRQIEAAIGLQLPADLQQDVDTGRITEERAQELSMARSRQQRSTERYTQERQQRQQQDQHRELETLRANIRSTTDAWAREKTKLDPDYSVKHQLVMDRVATIVRGRGRGLVSVQDTQDVLEQAYKDISGHLAKVSPRKQPINRTPADTVDRPTVSAEPQSFRDAVRQGFEKARAANG